MEKLHINTDTLTSCAASFNNAINGINEHLQNIHSRKSQLNFFEDARQLYDERIYFRIREMTDHIERCIAAGDYLRNIAVFYTQTEVMFAQNICQLSTVFSDTRAQNDTSANSSKYLTVYNCILNDTTLNITYEKRETLAIFCNVLLQEGYELEFVAGMLGNILAEGNFGIFESSAYSSKPKPGYLEYMDKNYNYRQKYSGQSIVGKSLSEVYNIVCELESKGYAGKFGLGSIQWTADRTKLLLETYKEVAGNSDTITLEQLKEAEAMMMVKELNGRYKSVYDSWKTQSTNCNSAADKAKLAGEILCKKYIKPRDSEAYIKRGNDAARIYNVVYK